MRASRNFLSIDDYERIETVAAGKNGIVLGPGIGTEEATAHLVLRLYSENSCPQVVDADALTILANHPDILRRPAGPRIFTPHPGEMARLLGSSVEQVQMDRLKAAQWLNAEANADWPPMITVLKGAGTVIAAASGAWTINTTGNPGMGTGGMGDVLAGIIGSLLVQGYHPWEAATLGVYLHGLAADRIASGRPYGYTASEVAQTLPEVIGILFTQTNEEKIC